MEPPVDLQSPELRPGLTPKTTCTHARLIDSILTERGTSTGKVRCVECGAVIDDPHHSLR